MFHRLLSKTPDGSKSGDDVQTNFYTGALHTFTTMFVKWATNTTFADTMQEALNIEKEMLGVAKKATP